MPAVTAADAADFRAFVGTYAQPIDRGWYSHEISNIAVAYAAAKGLGGDANYIGSLAGTAFPDKVFIQAPANLFPEGQRKSGGLGVLGLVAAAVATYFGAPYLAAELGAGAAAGEAVIGGELAGDAIAWGSLDAGEAAIAVDAASAQAYADAAALTATNPLMPAAVPENPATLREWGLVETSPGHWSLPETVASQPSLLSEAARVARGLVDKVAGTGAQQAVSRFVQQALDASGQGRVVHYSPNPVTHQAAGVGGGALGAGNGGALLVGGAVLAAAILLWKAGKK